MVEGKKFKFFYLNYIKPFSASIPILYPLETPENQRFSGIYRGCKMGTVVRNRLNMQFI